MKKKTQEGKLTKPQSMSVKKSVQFYSIRPQPIWQIRLTECFKLLSSICKQQIDQLSHEVEFEL